jgi:alkylation response protein AidB-like acyl-CoA dehydrogenase
MVTFQDVAVGEENIVGSVGEGFKGVYKYYLFDC